MLKKVAFFILFAGTILPTAASAQLDTRCFLENDCLQVRKDMGVSENQLADGFYQGPDSISACGGTEKINPVSKQSEKIGFCLPAGTTKTNITFGNKDSFLHLGEFIQFMYQYGILIAGALAVVMIVVGGVQYMGSGASGNTEAVNGAKKRIAGAVVGLTIALLSYTILSTINPQLVAFRLPQIWMINTIADPVEYCTDLKIDELVAPLGQGVAKTEDLPLENRKQALSSLYERGSFTQNPHEARCGNEFFIQQGNGFTCRGIACPRPGEACFTPPSVNGNSQTPRCVPAMLTGTIGAPARLMCGDLKDKIIDNDLKLIALCRNGDFEEIQQLDIPAGSNTYLFRVNAQIETVCDSKFGLAGFFLGADINDEGGGFFGGQCPGNPGSGGIDDWFAIGKTGPGSSKCSVNLGKLGITILHGAPNCEDSNTASYNCSCGAISKDANAKILSQNPQFVQHLITLEDLRAGDVCNLYISRDEFPSLDNKECPLTGLDLDYSNCWCEQDLL